MPNRDVKTIQDLIYYQYATRYARKLKVEQLSSGENPNPPAA